MRITVIDGQGGRLGKQIIDEISKAVPDAEIFAVGTNSIATAQMMKGNVKQAATGENSVAVACRSSDVIIGPIGIVIADAMLGEITPDMARSVAQSKAVRILIPSTKCDNYVAGTSHMGMSEAISDAVMKIKEIYAEMR